MGHRCAQTISHTKFLIPPFGFFMLVTCITIPRSVACGNTLRTVSRRSIPQKMWILLWHHSGFRLSKKCLRDVSSRNHSHRNCKSARNIEKCH
ncbi:hypothetical protein B9Z19DRAFT_1091949 [Tuber borchii]|uniref:Uncharacterized protein n=1 Tax=Tuber borchii TaxID=42251 RepID=A0A2T6ZH17_TUBBO|nr:hypothetical protein B9Z19DRAFT_1091949 [Tuber borchii]